MSGEDTILGRSAEVLRLLPSRCEPVAPPADRSSFHQIDIVGAVGVDKAISLAAIKKQLSNAEITSGSCPRHIHMIVNSTGGNTEESFKIYRFLRDHPAQVSAEVRERCRSAAVTIFLAADHRSARHNSEFLIHSTRIQSSNIKQEELTARDLRDLANELQVHDDRVLDLLALRTGFDRPWFEDQLQHEEYMTLTDALKCGLIHEIEGFGRCNPLWPETDIGAIPSNIILPARVLTANYFAACRAAPHRVSHERTDHTRMPSNGKIWK